MEDRPSGTVTFLFTDIEGSTRRWEADPNAMRAALASHDELLRDAIERHHGWLFKHTGDGVCAAFSSPQGAIEAAISAQRLLQLPVRMGIATGEAERRGDDYFGRPLNRAARVMAVGHGGQVLVSRSTAALVSGVDLLDLGEHRLRDLSDVEHLYQVRADNLTAVFPPLRSVDATPGNLPSPASAFVGRITEVDAIIELVRAHRLVTLTGPGGVGKTRLALQVAAELAPDFGDGVWFVELAPVGTPAAVPDAVAGALGVVQQAGRSTMESLAEGLYARRVLIVLDNCEHVLGAVADLAAAVLAGTSEVKLLTTSREGLRVDGERWWPVPPLNVRDGVGSDAVTLFVDRAVAVSPDFDLSAVGDADAVVEICERLDGNPLAIELAAARMVSTSPLEVLGLLTDRFRLLSGPRRGLERQQTLRSTVQWSYDLLSAEEQAILAICSVFAGTFDLGAARSLCDVPDDLDMLQRLDSLVRKSLVTTSRFAGRTRYGLLETVREFAKEQLASTGTLESVRDRHAAYFAAEAVEHWRMWESPRQRAANDWVDVEFANLRAAFRWALDRDRLIEAAAIAAHTCMMAFALQRFEPVGWAEELLPAARAADLAYLPRLYCAAAYCAWTGHADEAVERARTASTLESDQRYESFAPGWSQMIEAAAHVFKGRVDLWLEICTALSRRSGLARVMGVSGLTWVLPALGRADEAMAIADEALSIARSEGHPFFTAYAFVAYGRAFAEADPRKGLTAYRQGMAHAREHRLPFFEGTIGSEAAELEAEYGGLAQGLQWFENAIDMFHRAGNVTNLASALACLAKFLDRFGRWESAATLCGMANRQTNSMMVVKMDDLVDRLRTALGTARFDACSSEGAAMEPAEAVRYARREIGLARAELVA